MEYSEYLKTPHWRSIRSWAIERAGNHCQVCKSKSKLEVHHNNYDHVGAEQPDDLIVLCDVCHKLYEKRLPPSSEEFGAMCHDFARDHPHSTVLDMLEAVSSRMRQVERERNR